MYLTPKQHQIGRPELPQWEGKTNYFTFFKEKNRRIIKIEIHMVINLLFLNFLQ